MYEAIDIMKGNLMLGVLLPLAFLLHDASQGRREMENFESSKELSLIEDDVEKLIIQLRQSPTNSHEYFNDFYRVMKEFGDKIGG